MDDAKIKPKKERARAAAAPRASRDSMFSRMSRYLREVQSELKKTNWPTRSELIASTQVVLGLLIVVGLFIFVVDVALSFLFKFAGLGFGK